MLNKSGIYNIKNNKVHIRLPNPNDIIINWGNVDELFKKEFILFWHETCVLSTKKTDKQIYGISLFAYRQLILLDHVGYLVNRKEAKGRFETLYKEMNEKYAKALDMLITATT